MATVLTSFPVREWFKVADGAANLSVEVHDMYPTQVYLVIAEAPPEEAMGHAIRRGGIKFVTLEAGESLYAYAPGASPQTATLIVTS